MKIFQKQKIRFGIIILFGFEGNPIVGYSKQKAGMRLMLWSGKSFEDEKLNIFAEESFKTLLFFSILWKKLTKMI